MNQAEYDGLYGDAQLPVPKAPLIAELRAIRREVTEAAAP
jgi:hypothetical protein